MRSTLERFKRISAGVIKKNGSSTDTAEPSETGMRGKVRTLVENVLHPQLPRRKGRIQSGEVDSSNGAPDTIASLPNAGGLAPRSASPKNRFIGPADQDLMNVSDAESAAKVTSEKVFINPAQQSLKNSETRKLALKQTIAGRKLLYFPKEALCNELKNAAEKLKLIIVSMTQEELDFFMSFNFGTNELFSEKSSEKLLGLLDRLIDKKSASATDRAVLISIMGMIGKEHMGAAKQRSKGKAVPEKKLRFIKLFAKKIEMLNLPPLSDDLVNRIRLMGDSEALAPKKREEQPEESKQERAAPFQPRAGVHDLGEEADDLLGIEEGDRLPKVTWQLGEIEEGRVYSTTEPMVDHVSGRGARTLMIWDLFCGEGSEEVYKGVLEAHQREIVKDTHRAMPMEHLSAEQQQARLARIAGTCGMLIGVGYHTALELVEGALLYTGQNLRGELAPLTDAGNLLGDGAATDLMIELLSQQTIE